MIRNEIENQAESVFAQRIGKLLERFEPAEFGIDAGMIAEIVTMGAAATSRQERRAIIFGDSQPLEIRDQPLRLSRMGNCDSVAADRC